MVLVFCPFLCALIFSGLLSGFIAGLLGVGGGIIIVPILYHVLSSLGFSNDIIMHVSVATSLAIIIPTGWRSYVAHKKNNAVDFSIIKKWIIPNFNRICYWSNYSWINIWFLFDIIFFATIKALLVCIHLLTQNDSLRIGNQCRLVFLATISLYWLVHFHPCLVLEEEHLM